MFLVSPAQQSGCPGPAPALRLGSNCSLNPSDNEYCADTGTTDVIDNYAALVSYTRAHNEYATLGGNTRLKIEGRGTAIYGLNGRVVKTRNCLDISLSHKTLFTPSEPTDTSLVAAFSCLTMLVPSFSSQP